MKFSLVFVLSIVIWILLIYIIYDKFHTSSTSTDNQTKIKPTVIVEEVPMTSNVKIVEVVKQPVKPDLVKAAIIPPVKNTVSAIEPAKTTTNKQSKVVQRDIVKTAKSYKVGGNNGIAWNEFLKLDREVPGSNLAVTIPEGVYFNTCSQEVVTNVTEPALSKENYEWCQWTLSPTGGGVKV